MQLRGKGFFAYSTVPTVMSKSRLREVEGGGAGTPLFVSSSWGVVWHGQHDDRVGSLSAYDGGLCGAVARVGDGV